VLAVAAKELQTRILDFVHAKSVIQRLNDVQDAAHVTCLQGPARLHAQVAAEMSIAAAISQAT
jgi:hypothetical protein